MYFFTKKKSVVKIRLSIFQRILFKLSTLQRNAELYWMISNLKNCGSSNKIDSRVFIWSPDYVELGNNIDINGYTVINGRGGVIIENNVLIGANCVISSVTHPINIFDRHELNLTAVILRENCWLGASVTVLPGVTIGKNSVVAAGSVVINDIPENCICAGVPAIVKRFLNELEMNEVKKCTL